MATPGSNAELDKLFDKKVDMAINQTKKLRKNMYMSIAVTCFSLGCMGYVNYTFNSMLNSKVRSSDQQNEVNIE